MTLGLGRSIAKPLTAETDHTCAIRNTAIRVTLLEPEISSSQMGHLPRMQTHPSINKANQEIPF